jgi:hypothetical protein
MNVSISSLQSLLPIFTVVAVSIFIGIVLARGDDATARRRRSER